MTGSDEVPANAGSLRAKVLAVALIPSLSLMLVGLGTAAYTGFRGYQAVSESGRYAALGGTGRPSPESTAAQKLLQALRLERELSAEVLADPAQSPVSLRDQWERTNGAVSAATQAGGAGALDAAELATLADVRRSVTERSVALVDGVDRYSDLIVAIDQRSAARLSEAVPDSRVVREDEINRRLAEVTEAVLVSHALAGPAFTNEGMPADAFRAYARYVGNFLADLRAIQPLLPPDEASQLNLLTTGSDGEIVTVVQRDLLNGSVIRLSTAAGLRPTRGGLLVGDVRVVGTLPVPRADWEQAETKLAAGLIALQEQHRSYAAGIARDVGRSQLTRALIGSLILVVLAAAVLLVSLAVSRSLIGRLRRLRSETLELSRHRLPEIVRRLRAGEEVDVAAELPDLRYGGDEIGQVARAFEDAQRTAVSAAVAEGHTRTGMRTVFMDLAHRSQAIVYRQLRVLDQAERTQEDPDQLELLFRLDHLATRTRRNAENLIILGGGNAGRQWTNPIPLRQVVRSAISEAEDYTRVVVAPLPPVEIPGTVVSDVIHLLAELVDNATNFSPPTSQVEVRGNLAGRGLILEIEDQGLGMDSADMERFNRTLYEAPDFDVMALAEEPRLGLFVVARLAARHGIRVTLTPSVAYGGTRVVLLVPAELLLREERGELERGSGPVRALSSGEPAVRVETGDLPPDLPAVPDPASAQPTDGVGPLALPPTSGQQTSQGEPAPSVELADRLSEPSQDRPALPRRIRQAHLPTGLRPETARSEPEPTDQAAESSRSRMSALQQGTHRGRAEGQEDDE